MKKLFLFLLAIISLAMFSISSCSSDNNENNDSAIENKLIGKWQLTKVIEDGVTTTSDGPFDDSYEQCDFEGWIELLANGIAHEYDFCEDETDNFTWKVIDGQFVIVYEDLPIEIKIQIKELTASILILTIEVDGFISEATYQRLE